MPDQPTITHESDPKVLVGLVASAGGLEAMSLFVQHLPVDLPCAYVLAQHISPTHKSLLATLLSRETPLRVCEVRDRMPLETNTIYVPSAGQDIVVEDNHVLPRDPVGHPSSPKPSGDRLLASMADCFGKNSVGIVLSGTGSDGSYGVNDVREAGGITIAQEPASSKYDTMPVSAIETGCIDLTLTPQQIGDHLETILAQPRDLESLQRRLDGAHEYSDIFQILLARTRVDFREYKENTLNRRIQRRMIAKGIDRFEDYVTLCRTSIDEVDALYRDLLISVTRFFRDHREFEALRHMLDDIAEAAEPDARFRVWVPGCATGEEAYTIAILFAEAMGGPETLSERRLQVFATDIDESALTLGRRGSYPLSAQADIPHELIEKYFEVGDQGITAIQPLRNCLLFSKHNVFQDAPFTNIDLISIRNVLIYFNSGLQGRVLTRLQYALQRNGLLVLGTSETLGEFEMMFDQLNPRAKIFRKRGKGRRDRDPLPSSDDGLPRPYRYTSPPALARQPQGSANWLPFEALARVVAPIGFLANERREMVKIFGDLSGMAGVTDALRGSLTVNVLHPELAADVTSLIPLTLRDKSRRTGTWQKITGPDFNRVRAVGYPVERPDGDHWVLVALEKDTVVESEPVVAPDEGNAYTRFVEAELASAREALQVTTEELQTSNEELQSTNEELQSSNEELQSTNEELETSNEELQSTNEELITVNEELLINSSELEAQIAEKAGIISALPSALITLDTSLVIRAASNRAIALLELTNHGDNFGHLSQASFPAGFPRLLELCNDTLRTREPKNFTLEIGNAVYDMRIATFNSSAGRLGGLAVSILELAVPQLVAHLPGDLARLYDLLPVSFQRSMAGFGAVGAFAYDTATETIFCSTAMYRMLGHSDRDGPMPLTEAMGSSDGTERRGFLMRLDKAEREGTDLAYRGWHVKPDGERVLIDILGTLLPQGPDGGQSLVGVCRDYSAYLRDNPILQQMTWAMGDDGAGFFAYDIDNDLTYWGQSLFDMLGLQPDPMTPLNALVDVFVDEDRQALSAALTSAVDGGAPIDRTLTMKPDLGGHRCRIKARTQGLSAGSTSHVFGVVRILGQP